MNQWITSGAACECEVRRINVNESSSTEHVGSWKWKVNKSPITTLVVNYAMH